MKILLDSNFLIDSVRFRVFLEEVNSIVTEPCTFATLDTVIQELRKISEQKTKVGGDARLALVMLNTYTIEILKAGRNYSDDAMLNYSKTKGTIVATNDVKLRRKLRALGKKSIYLKGKKHLAIG
ncbi:MAG: hypothetical protein HYW22_01150 [Candidatus Aenigmarchaeota archaeon]|nr:hypothetical protein [Candidatus Aenigmarchaeota archaeon]